MVVSCIAHAEQVEEFESRLVAAQLDEIYEERIADDEFLFAFRANDLAEARHIGGFLYRAGALEIDIDAEAA